MNKINNSIDKLKINDKVYFNHINKLNSIYSSSNIIKYKNKKINKSKIKYKLYLINKKKYLLDKENIKFSSRLSQIKPTKLIKNSNKNIFKKKIPYLYLNKNYDKKKLNDENKKYFDRLINKKSKYNKDCLLSKRLIKKINLRKGREILNLSYKIISNHTNFKENHSSFKN